MQKPQTETAAQILERFHSAPMSAAQVWAVAITFMLSALDGYDVLSVTFAAPAISGDWNIGKAALGIVLASGLAGMALGSFVLAPLADSLGRRRLIQACLALMGIGMLASAFTSSIGQLAFWRVVTGLGIGTCVAVINTLAAEFASNKRRPLVVSIMAIGYPVGGLVGGLLAAWLLATFNWQAVFLAGFVAALVALPLVHLLLPDSLSFLLSKGGERATADANRLLLRCGHDPIEGIQLAPEKPRRGYGALFRRDQLGRTANLTVVNLLYASAAYFVLSWLPQLVADAGFDSSYASITSATASCAGVVGGILLGWLGSRFNLTALTSLTMAGLGFAMLAFGIAPPSSLLLTAGIMGFFLFAGVSGFYATLASQFPTESRATGIGFVIGAGRISSAVAPLVAGWLFSSGLGKAEVSIAFGACAMIAAMVLLFNTHSRKPA